MKWEWYTGTVAYSEPCRHCYKPLREHAGAGIVKWVDGFLYAVGCLLDRCAWDDRISGTTKQP